MEDLEKSLNAAHDVHFLLKEAALEAYTSMGRWMGEREGSLVSGSLAFDPEVSFNTALVSIRDVLENLQETDPNLFWNKGQKDTCLDLLKPFCRETMKLDRKVARLTKMLGEHVGELEPVLIRFANETFQEKGGPGMTGSGEIGSAVESIGSFRSNFAKPRRGVMASIWKFLTCQKAKGHDTPDLMGKGSEVNSLLFSKLNLSAAPGESSGGVPAAGSVPFGPMPEPKVRVPAQQKVAQWSDERMGNWLTDNSLDSRHKPDGPMTSQAELLAKIVSDADAKWFPPAAAAEAGEVKEGQNQSKGSLEEAEVQNANEPEPQFSVTFPQDPFTFLNGTVRDLHALVSRITFNLRLMERNFYEPPPKRVKSGGTEYKELRDYVEAVKEVGKALGADKDKVEFEREEVELFQLLGSVYFQALDCIKNFETFGSLVRADASFLRTVVDKYRLGETPSDEETGLGSDSEVVQKKGRGSLDIICQAEAEVRK